MYVCTLACVHVCVRVHVCVHVDMKVSMQLLNEQRPVTDSKGCKDKHDITTALIIYMVKISMCISANRF